MLKALREIRGRIKTVIQEITHDTVGFGLPGKEIVVTNKREDKYFEHVKF